MKINPKLMLARHALFTIYNKSSKNRGTYRVHKVKDKSIYFVGIKRPHSTYTDYIGTIFGNTFKHTSKSMVSKDSIEFRMFEWTFRNRYNLPACVEILHEGKCCKCGKTLTTPESIEKGIGPVCNKLYT